MRHGGPRNGAGRKIGSANLLTKELREKIDAEACINFLQNIALGKVKGASLNNRIDAATTLLKKTLPDCRQMEIMTEPIRTIEDDIRAVEAQLHRESENLGKVA